MQRPKRKAAAVSSTECSGDCAIRFITSCVKCELKRERAEYQSRRRLSATTARQLLPPSHSPPKVVQGNMEGPQPLSAVRKQQLPKGSSDSSSRPKKKRKPTPHISASYPFPETLPLSKKNEILKNACSAFQLSNFVTSVCSECELRKNSKDMFDDQLCNSCYCDCKAGKIPKNSHHNGFDFGQVPEELQNMTLLEEILISRARVRYTIVKLSMGTITKGELLQKAIRGNIIAFPQNAGAILQAMTSLPGPASDIPEYIKIILTGSFRTLAQKKTAISNYGRVRREVVRNALLWKQRHDPYYADILIDDAHLQSLPEDGVPEELVSSATSVDSSTNDSGDIEMNDDENVPFVTNEGVGYVDFSGLGIPTEQLTTVALENAILKVPHSADPLSEYIDSYWAHTFPTLFPFGTGLPNSPRNQPVSLLFWVRHCLQFGDGRFRKHPTFLFVAYNLLKKREICLNAKLRCPVSSVQSIAELISHMSADHFISLATKAKSGTLNWSTDVDRSTQQLLKTIQITAAPIVGSHHSKIHRRNEIRGMIVKHGLPTLWLTLNPGESHNPFVPLLSGLSEELAKDLNAHSRLKLVAEDPVSVAQFFDSFIDIVFEEIIQKGLLGDYTAHYGVVETQGRGGLHLHCLIWIRGVPTPEVLKRQLADDDDFLQAVIGFRDSIISECVDEIQDDDLLTIRSTFDKMVPPEALDVSSTEFRKISSFIASTLNMHKTTHTATCRKYGSSECRFNFPRKLVEQTYFDIEQGCIVSKRNHEWINTYNLILMYLLRCNHDIQMLTTSSDALALIYYITDYATKRNLKSHDLFQLVAAAFVKMMAVQQSDIDPLSKARLALIKCINTIGSTQEISGPLCALHILYDKEHYTNQTFVNLNWTTILSWYRQNIDSADNAAGLLEDTVMFSANHDTSNLRLDYMFRGQNSVLKDFNLYTYTTMVYKQPKKQKQDSASRYHFEFPHPLSDTHVQVIRTRAEPCVVLIGKSFPEMDMQSDDFYMASLLLFKPWSIDRPLREPGKSWQETFSDFFDDPNTDIHTGNPMADFNDIPSVLQLRDNIQLLRKCKQQAETCKAHFKELNEHTADVTKDDILRGSTSYEDDHLPDEKLDSSLLDDDGNLLLLELRNTSGSLHSQELQEMFTLNAFEKVGVLVQPTSYTEIPESFQHDLNPNPQTDLTNIAQWESVQTSNQETEDDFVDNTSEINSQISSVLSRFGIPDLSSIDHPALILDKVISERTLNQEQARAVSLIARHEYTGDSTQLLMYLGGAAGTGKSEVIKATEDYFVLRHARSALKLSASTGTAAAKFFGTTIHSICKFSRSKDATEQNKKKLSKRNTDLRMFWDPVKYLFIDEVSMISSSLLQEISETLQFAKENDLPFGGINVVLAGDFFQFPPVFGNPLYANLPSVNLNSEIQNSSIMGLNLWRQFKTVVLLTTNYRQKTDPIYQGLLERFLRGELTEDDVVLLKSRIINSRLKPPKNTQMVVNRNSLRIVLNDHFVNAIARETNRPLTEIKAVDSCNHEALRISHPEVKEKLLQIPDHKTDSLPGKLKLFVGMRCMVTANTHTPSGLSNGTIATVAFIPETRDSKGFPPYILLKLSSASKQRYPGLPPDIVPIFPVSGSFKVTVDNKRKATITITRRQFPLVPAYAITDYKSQGDTMSSVLLDIRIPPTGKWEVFFAVYVLLSRVSKLNGLYFMTDFDDSVLFTKPPTSILTLLSTLRELDAATKLQFEKI